MKRSLHIHRYQKQLEQLLQDRPDFVQPAKRRNEVLGWIRSGAQDFSLSRAKVDWGIRVPWDPSQTIYVWTDALHGYLSGTQTHLGGAFTSSDNVCCLLPSLDF